MNDCVVSLIKKKQKNNSHNSAMLKVQTGSKDYVSFDELDSFTELVLQFGITYTLWSLNHLSK